MKFQCERCKTRYSIADDRVKGKILKIRCKNCAAVITVKDAAGIAAPEQRSGNGGAPSSANPASANPSSGAAKLAGGGHGGGGLATARAAPAPSALAGAFARAIGKDSPPGPAAAPASYEAEWYVSVDGDQYGPYTLARAQEWVASQGQHEELHCWSEGFDDWLPVEKVSHFRGRRGPAVPAQSGRPGSEDEIEDRTRVEPLVLDAEAAAPASASSRSPTATAVVRPVAAAVGSTGAVAARSTGAAAAGSTSAAAARSRASTSVPRPAGAAASVHTEETPRPLFAKAMARLVAEAPDETPPPIDDPLARGGGNRGGGPSLGAIPAAGTAAIGTASLGAIPGAGTAARGTPPLDSDAASKAVARPASPLDAPARPDLAEPRRPDDLEIGEVSRVVDLAMLAPRIGGTTGAHPRLSGAAGVVGARSGADALSRSGLLAQLSGGTVGPGDATRSELLQPRPRQYRLFVAFGVAGVLLVGAIVVVLLMTIGVGEGEDIVRGRGTNDSIAFQFEQAVRKEREAQAAERANPGGRRSRRPRAGGALDGALVPGAGGSLADDGETRLGDGTGGPLSGEDLMRVQQQNQLGLQMCFNRELKRDPFLKVPKAYVALKVGLTGQVQSVSIPALAGTSLGACLEGFIRKWRFPRTTEIFSGQFPVVFSSR